MSSSDWARARKSGGVMQVGFFKPFQVEISSKVFRLLDVREAVKNNVIQLWFVYHYRYI